MRIYGVKKPGNNNNTRKYNVFICYMDETIDKIIPMICNKEENNSNI